MLDVLLYLCIGIITTVLSLIVTLAVVLLICYVVAYIGGLIYQVVHLKKRKRNDCCMTAAVQNSAYVFGKEKPNADQQPKANAKRIAEAVENTKKYIKR